MYKFKNIDDYIPERFESMGMLRGKRWYLKGSRRGLFKPRRFEYGDRKVFCGNHYGEFVGYLLSLNTSVEACEVELAHLSRYFPNIHKERNKGTPIEKDGCITYCQLKRNERLEHGKILIERFEQDRPEKFTRTMSKFWHARNYDYSDDIEIVLGAIEHRIREFYSKNENVSAEEVNKIVQEQKGKMISYIVYDCLYGNNDRHDENWAMKTDIDGNYISIYPLYDNERVLGLYENQNVILNAIKNDNVEYVSERILFSRMKVPGEKSKFSSYKAVLRYMMEHYGEETKKALQDNLNHNTFERISEYLDSCEGLPECYKEFSKRVYTSRREFAQNLIRKKELETSLEEK